MAGLHRRRPGGRHRRAREGPGHPVPRVHERRGRGQHLADPAGGRGQRRGAGEPRVRRRVRAVGRRDLGPRRPHDRVPLRRQPATAGEAAGEGRRRRVSRRRGAAGRPDPARAGAARQIAALLHQRDIEPELVRRPGTSRRASYRLSAGAATVASGPCRGRLVGGAVRAFGPADTVARFVAAARRAGLRTGSGTSVALVGYRGSGAGVDVVVSLDTPRAPRLLTGRRSWRVTRTPAPTAPCPSRRRG